MASYVIGDVHGCYDALSRLLDKIHYNLRQDRLFFTGDLVGRGAQPLMVLRKISQLPNCQLVLGNHDLHLIALYLGAAKAAAHPDASLTQVLTAADSADLIDWLRRQPLALYDSDHRFLLVHAGIAPQWERQEALVYAAELEAVLQAPQDRLRNLINGLYGDEPTSWQTSLTGVDRLRLIANTLTRMRRCTARGELLLAKEAHSGEHKPWFKHPRPNDSKIIFGHWAALAGETGHPNIIGMDYGCIWGHSLAALRLEDHQIIKVAAKG